MLIIARIESFILGKGMKDALIRAENYSKAGADAILIQVKKKSKRNISIAKIFKKNKFLNLSSCPSTYSSVKEDDLINIISK